MSHPTSKRSKLAGALLGALLVSPAPSAAQAPAADGPPPARTTVIVAVGGGEALEPRSFSRDMGALAGTVGARRRVWRDVTLEGAVQLQHAYATGSDLPFVCTPVAPGSDQCRARGLARQVRDADTFASALARVGVERRLGRRGPFVRAAAGGGHMTEVSEPFATVAGGLSLGGRRARLALDVDRWWSGVDATEVTLSMRDPQVRSERAVRERATSTFVRLGVELPVGGR